MDGSCRAAQQTACFPRGSNVLFRKFQVIRDTDSKDLFFDLKKRLSKHPVIIIFFFHLQNALRLSKVDFHLPCLEPSTGSGGTPIISLKN